MTQPGVPAFRIAVTHEEGRVAIAVDGELDAGTASQLRDAFVTSIAEGHRSFVIDLSATSFIDSTGLGILVGCHRRAAHEGGTLVLRNPRQQTVKLLELTALTHLFTIDG